MRRNRSANGLSNVFWVRRVVSIVLAYSLGLAGLLVSIAWTQTTFAQSNSFQSGSTQIQSAQIDSATRDLLAPWFDHWDSLPAADRKRLLSNARRWQAMSAQQRAAYLQRSAAWDTSPPATRMQRRERYAAWQALSPAEQARVRTASLRFAALSAQEQQTVGARFYALDSDVQRGWLLGSTRGAWIAQALPLFAYVPDVERSATLSMLDTLPETAHAALLEVARRLSPPQRDQLRQRLLAVPIAARADLLQRELAR